MGGSWSLPGPTPLRMAGRCGTCYPVSATTPRRSSPPTTWKARHRRPSTSCRRAQAVSTGPTGSSSAARSQDRRGGSLADMYRPESETDQSCRQGAEQGNAPDHLKSLGCRRDVLAAQETRRRTHRQGLEELNDASRPLALSLHRSEVVGGEAAFPQGSTQP